MSGGIVEQVRVMRIEELDTLPVENLVDVSKVNWGLVELDGKVYKYNIQEHMAAVESSSKLLADLVKKVDDLSKVIKGLEDGIDENTVIEP